MNACLQCLMPITDLRDYYLSQEFTRFSKARTVQRGNDYSKKFYEFFSDVYSCDSKNEMILNPTGLKNLIRKRFYPMMQHDSHEFFMHLIGSL